MVTNSDTMLLPVFLFVGCHLFAFLSVDLFVVLCIGVSVVCLFICMLFVITVTSIQTQLID